jgi:threonine aldolase
MRAAMAAAEVGDDVYGEDPTVNRLEARAAEIFGREAALFVPTGTMGNQIAVRMHTEHGQEVICESRGHLVDWEMSMVSAFSGCQLRTVYADRGILTWPLIRKVDLDRPSFPPADRPDIAREHAQPGRWNGDAAGSSARNLGRGRRCRLARASRWRAHLQCRRRAGYARRPSDRRLCSVMFCLSKGLCAPVGSMLVSSRAHIERARNFRKALGGGMRQAGILAAAGLIALDEMTGRLQEDHDNARLLADAR